MNKPLLIFAAIYFGLNIGYLHYTISNPVSHSFGFIFYYPALWLIGAIVLFILYKINMVNFNGNINKILLLFATPVASFLYYFLYLQFLQL